MQSIHKEFLSQFITVQLVGLSKISKRAVIPKHTEEHRGYSVNNIFSMHFFVMIRPQRNKMLIPHMIGMNLEMIFKSKNYFVKTLKTNQLTLYASGR